MKTYQKAPLAVILASWMAVQALSAQVVEEFRAPRLQGETTLRLGWQNFTGSSTTSATPGVSAEVDSSNLSLTLDGKASLPSVRPVRTSDGDWKVDSVGYEVGLKVDGLKAWTFTPGTSRTSSSSTDSSYSRVQAMVDWYENNKARFGLPENPFGAAGWPGSSYGSETGRYVFLKGSEAEGASDVVWSSQRWADALALSNDIQAKIEYAIDHLASDVVSTGDVDQYVYQALTAEGKKKALNKQRALKSFRKVVSGTSTSAAFQGPQLSSAWVALANLGGLVDLRADFLGATLQTGALIRSPRASQSESGAVVSMGLNPSVLPGFSARVAVDAVGGIAQTVENWDTSPLEFDPGEEAELGVLVQLGSSGWVPGWNSEWNWDAAVLLPDGTVRPGNLSTSTRASWKTLGDLSTEGTTEVQWLRWSGRYESTVADAWAWAAQGQVSWVGLTPGVKYRWKGAGFGGTGGNRTQDRYPGVSAQGDFDAVSVGSASFAEASFRLDPRGWLGWSAAWLEGSVNGLGSGMVPGETGWGWLARLGLDARDLWALPLTAEFGLSSYENRHLTKWGDSGQWDPQTVLDQLTWRSTLRFTPIKNLGFTGEVSLTPSSSRRDGSRIVAAHVLTTIQF